MGVRGLTSFIARHAELYLTPYELHDCCLVIDGDNLACNLYRDVTGTYSAFGGDYDDFYRGVVEFFSVLAECNVRAFVLMDGGYERRKLRTVDQRMRGKISAIKRINPNCAISVFPILMKEVFVDAVRACGVPVMRCVFEADDELAALGRLLDCPVLSYDSDFYIHNVRYIPLITVTVKAHTRRLKQADAPERRLRKQEAKSVEKRTKSQCIMRDIQTENHKPQQGKQSGTYKYLDCCIYRVKNLIARGSLSKEKLPLFAALLGNDYIARSSFKNFFSVGLGKKGRSKKMRFQQKRIRLILLWLKGETAQSALEKILTRLRKSQRNSLLAQMQAATSGYSNELCHSYDFFKANHADYLKKCIKLQAERIAAEEDEEEGEEEEEEEQEEEEEELDTEEEDEEEQSVEEEENKTELEEKEREDDEEEEEYEEEEEEEEQALVEDDNIDDKTKEFPTWFLDKLYPAHLSRFFVDLMHLRKYINSPQIEHFPYNDCHAVALPILQYIFTLLHTVAGAEVPFKVNENGEECPLEFTYMTRAQKVTNVRFYRFPVVRPLPYSFDPCAPNPLLLRHIFEINMPELNVEALFSHLSELPNDLQLYFLSIVYWLHKAEHYDILHLHAIIVCLVVLRSVDTRIPVERNPKAFQRRFGKIIKRERLVREKDLLESGQKRGIRADLLLLPMAQRIEHVPKSDCLLVQEQLLKHFHMQELFKKKYDNFSTQILHGFAQLQSIVFQLNALNALLDLPYVAPKMASCISGVFLYNLYDLLRVRVDIAYYVEHNIFKDSPLMYDFYNFLFNWCAEFLPSWKQQQTNMPTSKKVLKKQRQLARKKAAKETETTLIDPYADMLEDSAEGEEDAAFCDLNNKFCTFLQIH